MKLRRTINKTFLFFGMLFYNLPIYAIDQAAKKELAKRLLAPSTASASKETSATISNIARDVFNFEQGLQKLIRTVAIFGGITCLFFSLQLYFKYRKDPTETKPFTIIFLLLIGLALIFLSIVPLKV